MPEGETARAHQGKSGFSCSIAAPFPCGAAGLTAAEQARVLGGEVRDPATWTIFQQDGPNHLGLW